MKNKTKKSKLILTTLFLSCFFVFATNHAQAYVPPIGIPDPGMWGTIHPIDSVAPDTATKCPAWPSAATTGCYYIDNSGTCTNTSNTYGYPNNPRCDFPTSIAAGAYVEIHGGPYLGDVIVTSSGTSVNPVWFRGTASAKPIMQGRIRFNSSTYTFIENLDFNGGEKNCLYFYGSAGNNIVIRSSTFRNRTLPTGQDAAAIGMTPNVSGVLHDIVVYNCEFSELGNWQLEVDDDFHGINPSLVSGDIGTETYLYNIWVLSNTFYHLSGNGLQSNASDYQLDNNLHHVYAGFNTGHANRQSVLWSKQGSDIIFSQNVAYDNRDHGPQPGDGAGFQYGPNNLWIIFNDFYDSNHGVRQSSTSTLEGGTDNIYILGNKIHDINPNPTGTPAYLIADYYKNGVGVALNVGGGPNYTRHIIDNTIYNAYCGVSINQNSPVEVDGNIISNINDSHPDSQGYTLDYHIMNNQDTTALTITNNLFYSAIAPFRMKWAGATYTTIAALISAKSTGTGSAVEDPLFVNADAGNYRLQETSPAIGGGVKNAAYAAFQSRYGLNIDVDFDGNARPATGSRSLGAFEYYSGADSTAPASPSGLSVL